MRGTPTTTRSDTGEAQLPDLGTVFEVRRLELAGAALRQLREQRERVVVRDQIETEPWRDRTQRTKDGRMTDRMGDLSRVEHDLVLVGVTARAPAGPGLARLGGTEIDRFGSHHSTIAALPTLSPGPDAQPLRDASMSSSQGGGHYSRTLPTTPGVTVGLIQ